VADVKGSADFYSRVLRGTVVRDGEPSVIQLTNSWMIVNVGGGPTDDKPTVILHTPRSPDEATSFLNIRVADISACYDEWRQKRCRVRHRAKASCDGNSLLSRP
jgi:hypothetical protein